MTAATAPTPRPGRNEPCHCGSGRKYKHCCLAKDDLAATAALAAAAAAAAEEVAQSPEAATSAPARAPKPDTPQPWKRATSRGFIPRSRTPRKVGGS
jgi:SEC-C motif